jgi:hypothetical protein
MKQNDIVLIIVFVFIGGTASFFLSNLLISAPKNRQTPVEVVERLSADFNQPDERYFNKDSINPTQLIKIGDNAKTTPKQ